MAAPEGSAFYRALKSFGVPLLRCYFRLRVEGAGNVPVSGPCVLSANHQSYLDPVVLAAACPRPVRYMMTRDFWDRPLVGWVCRRAGSFPVDDGGIKPATLRQAIGVLRDGHVLGIFPEGGIATDGLLRPGREGAARLALREGVPLLPAGIIGTRRAFPKGRLLPRPSGILVRFGTPVVPPTPAGSLREIRRQVGALNAELMARISALAEARPA